MSILRGNDISVDANTGLGEEVAESSKLAVRVRISAFRSELRRGLGGDGGAISDRKNRGFWGNSEEFGVGFGSAEKWEREGDEAEVGGGVVGQGRGERTRCL